MVTCYLRFRWQCREIINNTSSLRDPSRKQECYTWIIQYLAQKENQRIKKYEEEKKKGYICSKKKIFHERWSSSQLQWQRWAQILPLYYHLPSRPRPPIRFLFQWWNLILGFSGQWARVLSQQLLYSPCFPQPHLFPTCAPIVVFCGRKSPRQSPAEPHMGDGTNDWDASCQS